MARNFSFVPVLLNYKHGDAAERKKICCHFCHLSMRSNYLIFKPLLQMLKVTATKNKTKIGDWEGVVTQGCVKDVCVFLRMEKSYLVR